MELNVSEKQQQLLKQALEEFKTDQNPPIYRIRAKGLIDQFVVDAEDFAEQAIAARDDILSIVSDDMEAVVYIDSILDESTAEMIEEVFGDGTLEGMSREETWQMLRVFVFTVEIFRYTCARDQKIPSPEEAREFFNAFVVQVENYFNPALAEFCELKDKSGLH